MFIAPEAPQSSPRSGRSEMYSRRFRPYGAKKGLFACLVYKHLAPLGRKHSVIRPAVPLKSDFQRCNRHHSVLNATSGSTLVARRAGR
jgi:hypothetical protein